VSAIGDDCVCGPIRVSVACRGNRPGLTLEETTVGSNSLPSIQKPETPKDELHEEPTPPSAGATPPEVSQVETGTRTSADATRPEGETDGPPATVWKVAFSLVGTITVFAGLFKIWDESDFPETFTSPWFWMGAATIASLTFVWAWYVRRTDNWLDSGVLIVVAIGALTLYETYAVVIRKATPSDDRYSITVFTFTGTDDRSVNAAKRLRGAVIRAIDNLGYASSTLEVPRDRDRSPKGTTPAEKVQYLTGWARRSTGCHLAIWTQVEMQKARYNVTVHYIKVSPFGNEVHEDILGHFKYWRDTFEADPAGDGISLGTVYCGKDKCGTISTLDRITTNLRFLWGLAEYQKGDTTSALHDLPAGYANSEYYAGQAAYFRSWSRVGRSALQTEAVQHYRKAIELHPEQDSVRALFYFSLGTAYLAKLIDSTSNNPDLDASNAIAAFGQSGEIAQQLHDEGFYASTQVRQAMVTYTLYSAYQHRDLFTRLIEAQQLINQALPKLDGDEYWEATRLLALIYFSKAGREERSLAIADYRNAIDAHERALNYFQGAGSTHGVAAQRRLLGYTTAKYGKFIKDASKIDEGVKYLQMSVADCSVPEDVDLCFKGHRDSAVVAVDYASIFRDRSAKWTEQLDRAVKEYRLAEGFLSKVEQPDTYGELKNDLAGVYTKWAIGETQDKQEQLFQSAVTELSEGISVVGTDGPSAARLYKSRAEAYRRLYDYSAQPDQGYKKLSHSDDEAARLAAKHSMAKGGAIEAN